MEQISVNQSNRLKDIQNMKITPYFDNIGSYHPSDAVYVSKVIFETYP